METRLLKLFIIIAHAGSSNISLPNIFHVVDNLVCTSLTHLSCSEYSELQKLREGSDGVDLNREDCSKFILGQKKWKDQEVIEAIRDRFVTGDWSKAARRNQISKSNDEDGDDSTFGDFEDLETGEKYGNHETGGANENVSQKEKDSIAEERRLKKLALRAKFDSQYPFTLSHLLLKSIEFS